MLARLLPPTDFGLIGMATVITGFVTLFKDLGTGSAIIQRRERSDEFLSTIFWVNVLIGILSAMVISVLAPLVATFFGEPRLTSILRGLSLCFVFSGLTIVFQTMLERDLQFERLAKVEIIGTLAGAAIGIGTAILGYGAWSLVYQTLAMTVVTTGLLPMACRWRPRWHCSFTDLSQILVYSLNLTGFNLFNYFARNADNILIGKFLGPTELGYYTIAYRLMFYPIQAINSVVGRVMFPIYAELQENNARFQAVYLRLAGALSAFIFPLMLGLVALAEPFVLAAFGSRWEPIIPLIFILAPVGMLHSIVTTVGNIYQAKGRTDLLLGWGLFSGTLAVMAFAAGLPWGILGVAAAYAATAFILAYPGLAIPFRLIGLPVVALGATLWRPLFCSLLMLVSLMLVKIGIPALRGSTTALIVLVPLGIALYSLFSWWINQEACRELFNLLRLRPLAKPTISGAYSSSKD